MPNGTLYISHHFYKIKFLLEGREDKIHLSFAEQLSICMGGNVLTG